MRSVRQKATIGRTFRLPAAMMAISLLACGCNFSRTKAVTKASLESCTGGEPISFQSHILPMMQRSCVSCHSGPGASGGFQAQVYLEAGATRSPAAKWASAWQQVSSNAMPREAAPLAGCDRTILKAWVDLGAPEVAVSIDGTPKLDCTARDKISVSSTRRLTKAEFSNTLRDLFGPTVFAGIASDLAAVPDDSVTDSFDSFVRGVSSSGVDSYFAVSEHVGDLTMSSATTRQALDACLGTISSATAASAESCITSFLRGFGKKVLRRPLKVAEEAKYLALYRNLVAGGQTREDSAKGVLVSLLNTPQFLYHLETEGAAVPGQPGVFALSQYELASRLSYLVWGSTPDDALMSKAGSGALSTPDQLQLQAQAMFVKSNPKARDTAARFHRQWLALDRTHEVNQSPAFLGSVSPSGLRDDMVAELDAFTDFNTFEAEGKYSDLMTSQKVFARSSNLASIYGVPKTTDMTRGSDAGSAVRDGLLTRAARLNDGRDESSPIFRGVFIRRHLLCDDLPAPDPSKFPPDFQNAPPPDPTKTGRQRWTEKTAAPACMSCHSQINPLGFAFEKYDSIGRFRTKEANGAAIDDSIDLILDGTDPVHIEGSSGARGLASAFAASRKANECYARQWFRFSTGRRESYAEDACQIQDLYDAMNGTGGSARQMMIRLAGAPEFRFVREGN